MKKQWAFFCCLLVFISLLTGCQQPTTSQAEKSETDAATESSIVSDVNYTYDEETETLTFSGVGEMKFDMNDESYLKLWDIEKPTHIVISSGITSVQDYFFSYSIEGNTGKERNHFNQVKTIELADTVKKIGDSAFGGCSIEKIVIPDSVIEIGDSAFNGCLKLKSVVLPDGIEYIGWGAFADCYALEELVFPSSLHSISEGICQNCEQLHYIELSTGVDEIQDSAFAQCTNLETVKLSDTLTKIGNGAFYHCSKISEISFPNTLLEVGEIAMADCFNLKTVKIPASVTLIGENAFGYDDETEEENYTPIDNFVIKGYHNSAAQTYAEENQFEFIALD